MLWTTAFAADARLFLNTGTFFLGFANYWVGDAHVESQMNIDALIGVSALGLCQDPGVNPSVNSNNSMSVQQNSGVNRTVDRAHFAIVRLGDFS